MSARARGCRPSCSMAIRTRSSTARARWGERADRGSRQLEGGGGGICRCAARRAGADFRIGSGRRCGYRRGDRNGDGSGDERRGVGAGDQSDHQAHARSGPPPLPRAHGIPGRAGCASRRRPPASAGHDAGGGRAQGCARYRPHPVDGGGQGADPAPAARDHQDHGRGAHARLRHRQAAHRRDRAQSACRRGRPHRPRGGRRDRSRHRRACRRGPRRYGPACRRHPVPRRGARAPTTPSSPCTTTRR